jgi:hypothetical protein
MGGRWRRRHGSRHCGLRPLPLLQALIKRRLGVTLSLPARAVSKEDPSRLLAQPALHAEPALLACCSLDPWDANRQVLLPLAYPGSYPHNKYVQI